MMSTANAAVVQILPMKQCIQTNNAVTGPLKPFLNMLEGAVGGVFIALVPLFLIVGGVMALVAVVRGARSGSALQVVVGVIIVAVAVILLLAFATNFIPALNHKC